MPVTQVRDITIQKRENDLVMATFGRGFWVLDDISALREINPATLNEEARLFPLRHAYSFVPGGIAPAGASGVGVLSGNFTTPNPPVGAYITYNVKQEYPADTKLVLTITDNGGAQVRRCEIDKTAGLKRFTWNLNADPGLSFGPTGQVIQSGAGRAGGGGAPTTPPATGGAAPTPTMQMCVAPAGNGGFGGGGGGGGGRGGQNAQRVPNGLYRASIGKMVGTTVTTIGPSQTFEVKALLQP